MEDEPQMDLNIGLSEEERKDLENLIGLLKDEKLSLSPNQATEDLRKQNTFLNKKVIRISVMLLDFDRKISSLHEVVSLLYRKTEVMNARINDLIKFVKSKEQR